MPVSQYGLLAVLSEGLHNGIVSFYPGHGLCVLRRESRLVSRCSQMKILVGYVFEKFTARQFYLLLSQMK